LPSLSLRNANQSTSVAKKRPPLICASPFAGADVYTSQFLMGRRKRFQILSHSSMNQRATCSVSDPDKMYDF